MIIFYNYNKIQKKLQEKIKNPLTFVVKVFFRYRPLFVMVAGVG